MAIQTRWTVAAYEQFIALPENTDRRIELIDGEIVEKNMPTQEHGVTGSILNGMLFIWWDKGGRKGWLMIETRVGLPDDDANDRIPDLSYITPERAEPLRRKGAVPYMPDLAVEILSPDESLAKTRAKIQYYLDHGTRLAWLLIPAKRAIEVYRANGEVELLTAEQDDILDGGDVLLGFAANVKTIV
ncbi:MAG: Uma2 family endonuclease [Chloroflexota bacterium]|nr:Uma2 family endonuclease [Chloroflexota bacterium]